MNKKLLIAFSCLFALSSCAPVPNSNPNTPNDINDKNMILIEGIALDQQEKPVADADIIVKDDIKIVGQTKTDKDGNFVLKVPKSFSGSFVIEAKKVLPDGNLSQTIIISEGKRAEFKGENSLKKILLGDKPVAPPA